MRIRARVIFAAWCVLLLFVRPSAADPQAIEQRFLAYWTAFSSGDFPAAADIVAPEDLAATKAALLPLFLQAQAHANPQIQELVAAFFGSIPTEERPAMTSREVYCGLNRILQATDPAFFDLLRDSKVTVQRVDIEDDEFATIAFELTLLGQTVKDHERMARRGGHWWLRVKEDPKVTAAKFQRMLQAGTGAQ